jgi:hypothetical protein
MSEPQLPKEFWQAQLWLDGTTFVEWLTWTRHTQAWALYGDSGAWWVLHLLAHHDYVVQDADPDSGVSVRLAHAMSPEQLRDVIVVLAS